MLTASTAYKMSRINAANIERNINLADQIDEINSYIFKAANNRTKICFKIKYEKFIPKANLIKLIKEGYKVSIDDKGYNISWD